MNNASMVLLREYHLCLKHFHTQTHKPNSFLLFFFFSLSRSVQMTRNIYTCLDTPSFHRNINDYTLIIQSLPYKLLLCILT